MIVESMKKIFILLLIISNTYAAITQKESEELSNSLLSIFQPEIAELSYPVKLDLFWKGPIPMAITSFEEDHFSISIWGALTRHKMMTPKTWIYTLCHELGHIIGGAPHVTNEEHSWGSSEGQADVFASSICLPRYYESLEPNSEDISTIRFNTAKEMSKLLNAMADNSEGSNVESSSSEVVSETITDDYPSTQCRIDTIKFARRLPCWFKE